VKPYWFKRSYRFVAKAWSKVSNVSNKPIEYVLHTILFQKFDNQCKNVMHPFGHPKIKAYNGKHKLLKLAKHKFVWFS